MISLDYAIRQIYIIPETLPVIPSYYVGGCITSTYRNEWQVHNVQFQNSSIIIIPSFKVVALNGTYDSGCPVSLVCTLTGGFMRGSFQFFLNFPAFFALCKLPDCVSGIVHMLVGSPLVVFWGPTCPFHQVVNLFPDTYLINYFFDFSFFLIFL